MILKGLKLNNIRSYPNEEITFPEGSILLSGDIGSGKSSILLAIEFALFGIMRKHLSGSGLLRNGENKGSVELHLEIDQKDIIIKRTLKRQNSDVKQDSGYIITDGTKTELTPAELKSKIIEILGYPEELATKSKSLIYRYTVYTPQEDMKKIILESADIRLDTLQVYAEDGSNQNLEEFTQVVKLNAGSDALRFSDLLLTMNLQNQSSDYEYSASVDCTDSATTTPGGDYGILYSINGSSNKVGYLNKGDVVKLCFEAPKNVTESEELRLALIPKVGTPNVVEFNLPDLMVDTRIEAFP